jgi:hypothetical protein
MPRRCPLRMQGTGDLQVRNGGATRHFACLLSWALDPQQRNQASSAVEMV